MEQPQQPQAPQAAPRQPVQSRKPSESANNTKVILGAVAIVVVIAAGYFLFTRYGAHSPSAEDANPSASTDEGGVEVVSTPLAGGKMQPPAGLPAGIPLEAGNITESNTTNFPEQGARQLAVAYVSTKPVTEVYNAFLSYMKTGGYNVSEGGTSSPVKAIFGTKDDAALSVAVSSQAEGTLVQISYLIKSAAAQ